MEPGTRKIARGGAPPPPVALRLWLWLVPIAMVAVAGVLSVIAALGGRWALLAVMIVVGVFGIGLLVLHWWVMYRFGRTPE